MLASRARDVNDLKNADAESLALLNDEQLERYLQDIINLEPKPLPTPLGSEIKEDKPKRQKKVKEQKEEVDNDGDGGCPIKSTTKNAKERTKLASLLAELEGEI